MRCRNVFLFLTLLHALGAGLCYVPDEEIDGTAMRRSPFFPSGKGVFANTVTSNVLCIEVKKIKKILNEAYTPPCCTEEIEGKIDCFVGDSAMKVQHVHIDATGDTHVYSGPSNLGGNAYSGMGCVSKGEGYVDVLTLTLDHQITRKSKNPAGWDSGWSVNPRYCIFLDRPECVYSTANRLDCFNRGTQNAPYNHWAIGTVWKNKQIQGAPLYSPLRCITRYEGAIDCFAIQRAKGVNAGPISHLRIVDTVIPSWEIIGREVQKEGTVTGTKDRMDFFGRGWDNQVKQRTWTATGGWGSWKTLEGGHFLSDPKCISAQYPYTIWCFAVGIDGYRLYRNIYSSNAWTGWKDGCDTSIYQFPEAPTCFFSKRNEVSCYGRDFNARLIEIVYDV